MRLTDMRLFVALRFSSLVLSVFLCAAIVIVASAGPVRWSARASERPPWFDTFERREAYDRTLDLWTRMEADNQKLRPAEAFVRSVLAEVRLLGKASSPGRPFGQGLHDVLSGREPHACFDLRLCRAKVVPAFRFATPIGVTDLIQYVLEGTCFGFLPDKDNRIAVLDLLNSVALRFDRRQLSEALTEGDKLYLRGDFLDVLATANAASRTRKRSWPGLRDLARYGHPRRVFASGRNRPMDAVVAHAARLACSA